MFSIMQDVVAACEIVNCNGVEVQCQVICYNLKAYFIWTDYYILRWLRHWNRDLLLQDGGELIFIGSYYLLLVHITYSTQDIYIL
jgi:hypothetical protein